jgi:hypothetical protein
LPLPLSLPATTTTATITITTIRPWLQRGWVNAWFVATTLGAWVALVQPEQHNIKQINPNAKMLSPPPKDKQKTANKRQNSKHETKQNKTKQNKHKIADLGRRADLSVLMEMRVEVLHGKGHGATLRRRR